MSSGEILEAGIKADLNTEAQREGDDEIPELRELIERKAHPGNQADDTEIDAEQQHERPCAELERLDESSRCCRRFFPERHPARWTEPGRRLPYLRVHRTRIYCSGLLRH